VSERQPVLFALDQLPRDAWVVLLCAVRGVNVGLAAVVMDDPTPLSALDAAIAAELARLGEV
jgi:hypothetical protein